MRFILYSILLLAVSAFFYIDVAINREHFKKVCSMESSTIYKQAYGVNAVFFDGFIFQDSMLLRDKSKTKSFERPVRSEFAYPEYEEDFSSVVKRYSVNVNGDISVTRVPTRTMRYGVVCELKNDDKTVSRVCRVKDFLNDETLAVRVSHYYKPRPVECWFNAPCHLGKECFTPKWWDLRDVLIPDEKE